MSLQKIKFSDYYGSSTPFKECLSAESNGHHYFGRFLLNSETITFNLLNGSGDEIYILTVGKKTVYNKASIEFTSGSIQCEVILPPKVKKVQLNTKLCTYFNKDEKYKMVFEVDEKEKQAIIPIMCARSPVIEAMMNSDCIEAKNKRIKITDFSFDVVKTMVEFCETDELTLPIKVNTWGAGYLISNAYRKIAFIAEKYDIDELRTAVSIKIMSQISTANFYDWFSVICKCNLKDLHEFCGFFARRYAVDLLSNRNITTLASDDLGTLTRLVGNCKIE